MIRLFVTLLLFINLLQSADRTIGSKEMSSFAMSKDLKGQIKAELMVEMNASLLNFRQQMEMALQEKFLQSEHTFKLDVIALKKEVKLLKENITLFKDMIVDTNYQRNVRDDKVRLLMDSVKAIEKRLNVLEEKKQPPLENKTGEKI
ncbi:MAG: hypothetical protein OIF32_05195 [Campylobacterales bacterium]|nr:hypothetical protein [Campylobacterales bacterium]